MTATLFDHFAVPLELVAKTTAAREINYKVVEAQLPDLRNAQFEPYRVQRIRLKNARNHPNVLVESANLAAIASPRPWYKPMIEEHIIPNGLLSLEQFETTVYGLQANERFFELPEIDEPVRGGYFMAHGTGVGKGRIACAMARDCMHRRPTIVLWFTLNELLIDDVTRDWTDMGGAAGDIVSWSRYSKGESIGFEQPVLFCSYALLGRTERYEQLVASIEAKGYDVFAIFDEAHAGINAAPQNAGEFFAENQTSDRGAHMLALQRAFPQMRVLYTSATGASRLDALAYAERLNLWGSGTPFANRGTFIAAMDKGGTAALEVVSQSLKALGRYSSFSIDFSGCEMETITHHLNAIQAEQLNDHLRVGRMIHHGMTDELLRLGAILPAKDGTLAPVRPTGSPLGGLRGTYETMMQRAAQQHLMSLTMPTVCQRIDEQLAAGFAVIVQISHTNAAAFDRALAKHDESDGYDSLDITGRDEMLRFIDLHYPIYEYKGRTADKKYTVEPKTDPITGDKIINPTALRNREKLRQSVLELDSPIPALDELYQRYGNRIVEVTGRSKQLIWVENPLTGKREAQLVKRSPKRANRAAIDAFTSGKADIIVISEGAGGVGVSLHSDIRFANQKRRYHLFLEISWRAEGLLQGAGRSNRTGQVNSPCYGFVCPDVPGFRRFLSTPARRMANLGAISKGQRDATDISIVGPEHNLETPLAQRALNRLLSAIAQGKHAITKEQLYRQTGIDCTGWQDWGEERVGRAKGRRSSRLPIHVFLNRLLQADVGVPDPVADAGAPVTPFAEVA